MSTGPVKPFIDYTGGASDTGTNDAASIKPYLNGESVEQVPMGRSPENLRLRTENLRGIFDDTLYLRDADRAWALGGPGKITWPLVTTGTIGLDNPLYLVPFLTPGSAQTPPIPPVASVYGKLVLLRANSTPGVTVTSNRRSYAGGDKISVVVVSGGSANSASAAASDTPARTIVLTVNNATLNQVVAALNGVVVDSPGVQLVTAVLTGGAGGDLLLVPQAKQYIVGNYDGEGHTLTQAAFVTFFGTPANRLLEGDTLCIQYAQMVDSDLASTSGRRQALPENSNTAVAASSLFNSRVNPEKLVNAIPICKVLNGRLVFINGAQIPNGAVAADLAGSAADVTYGGGGAWVDGTTNPATTVDAQLTKIIADLASTTSTDVDADDDAGSGADRIGITAKTYGFGALGAQSVKDRINAIEATKVNLATHNVLAPVDETDANVPFSTIVAPVTAYKPVFTGLNASAGGATTRIYVDGAGGLAVTANAKWVPGTPGWAADDAAKGSMITSFLGTSIVTKTKAAGAGTWVDGSWDVQPSLMDFAAGLLSRPGRQTLGSGFIGSQANALLPRIDMPARTASADLTLMLQSVAAGGKGLRLYSGTVKAALYITSNASYDGAAWNRDVTGEAFMAVFESDGNNLIQFYYATSGSGVVTWPANAFANFGAVGNSLLDLTAAGSARALNTFKCWYAARTDGTVTPAFFDSFGITSVAFGPAGAPGVNSVTFNFPAFTNGGDQYVPRLTVTDLNGPTAPIIPVVFAQTNSSITYKAYITHVGASYAQPTLCFFNASDLLVSFSVLGR